MRIAVIGSRKTKPAVMGHMCGIVRRLSVEYPDIEWVSGGCEEGPDNVITFLALKYAIKHIIYLPNMRRLNQVSRKGDLNLLVAADYATPQYTDIVKKLHPAPEYLKEFSFELHGRNLNIIAGKDLTAPVDAVLFAAGVNADGTVKGGTGMGVAYARTLDVPCFNANELDDVIGFLTLLKQFQI